MIDLVKKLIPLKGFIWKVLSGSDLDKFLLALGEEPKRMRNYLLLIIRESNPGTAIETQEDWFDQYGLLFEPTKPINDQQAESLERYIALGDQDIAYLQDQIEKAGFTDVTLVENIAPSGDSTNECGHAVSGEAECWNGGAFGMDWIFYYFVTGTVENDEEFVRLKDLIQKLAPEHLIPVYSIIASNNECGPAECGPAFCDG